MIRSSGSGSGSGSGSSSGNVDVDNTNALLKHLNFGSKLVLLIRARIRLSPLTSRRAAAQSFHRSHRRCSPWQQRCPRRQAQLQRHRRLQRHRLRSQFWMRWDPHLQ